MTQHRKHWLAFFLTALLISGMATIARMQDTEATPETDALIPVPTLEPTQTPIPVEIILTPTDIPTIEPTATVPPTVVVDVPVVTDEPLDVPAATDEAAATEVVIATDEAAATEEAPETTPDVIVTDEPAATEAPETTVTVPPTAMPSVTPLPMAILVGLAHYQNRLPDDAGILVVVRDMQGNILSQANTNSAGIYQVFVPPSAPFVLRISAPRHLASETVMSPDAMPSEIRLAGGDLNQDNCINGLDVALITAAFSTTNAEVDINNDGEIDAADIAILTGNYRSDCGTVPAVTPVPDATVEPTESVEPLPEATTETANS